jgi:hypothetical protein
MGNKSLKAETRFDDYVNVKYNNESNLDSGYKSDFSTDDDKYNNDKYNNENDNNDDTNYYEKSLYSYILEIFAYLFNEDVKYNKRSDCDYILFHKLQPSYFIGETFIGMKDSKYIITLWEIFEIKDFFKNNNEYIINITLNNEIPLLLKICFYESGSKTICCVNLSKQTHIYKNNYKEFNDLKNKLENSYNKFHNIVSMK